MPFLSPASPAQLEEILDATFPQWGEGLDRAGYARYNDAQRRTPWGASHLDRLVLNDGRTWLSTAKRYDLRARLDGRDLRVLGIGAVFTPPALRRRGHAAELLRRMLDQAEGEGFALALLFSEIGIGYYAALGFEPVPLTQLRLGIPRPDRPIAIPMRSGDSRDVQALAEMNAQQANGFRFALRREADYIAYTIAKKRLLAANGPPGRRRVEFFVMEEGGRAAAYLVLLEAGEYWMITECGDRDPSGARVGAMLQTLSLGARLEPWPAPHDENEQRREPIIRAWLPPGFVPPQATVLASEVPALTMMLRRVGRSAHLDPPLSPGDLAYWHADAF